MNSPHFKPSCDEAIPTVAMKPEWTRLQCVECKPYRFPSRNQFIHRLGVQEFVLCGIYIIHCYACVVMQLPAGCPAARDPWTRDPISRDPWARGCNACDPSVRSLAASDLFF